MAPLVFDCTEAALMQRYPAVHIVVGLCLDAWSGCFCDVPPEELLSSEHRSDACVLELS